MLRKNTKLIKQNFKENIIRSYSVLQEVYNFEFQNEDDLFTLLNQLGECLLVQVSAPYNIKDIERHIDYKLTTRLQRERELALCEIVLHRGSF
jgi:hypothetical protein